METAEKITPPRRERMEAILDTLGDIVETSDFSIHVSCGRAYVQLYSGLSELAGAHGAGIRVKRTDYGSVERTAVIDGAEYLEVDLLPYKPQTCPVCGEECRRTFRSERGAVLGCDMCLTAVEEYEDAEASETPEEPHEMAEA